MAFSSRLATLNDIPTLQDLIGKSVRSLSIGYYSSEQIESAIQHIFGIDTQLIADGTYYVFENKEAIVACGGWSKRHTLYGGDQFKQEADPLLDPAVDAARIRAFFVHPEWARQGLGRKMILKCEEMAKQAGFKTFELGSTLPGEAFYLAMGYKAVTQVNVPLADGVTLPVIKMKKAT